LKGRGFQPRRTSFSMTNAGGEAVLVQNSTPRIFRNHFGRWPAESATSSCQRPQANDIPMIAFLTLELSIEAAQSLKDKRQVVRSLKDRLRAHFNVAVAELDASGLWNRATVGVVSISDSRDYLDGLMKNVERQATRIANNGGADVADSFLEYL
jgi:uncharacterized protein